MSPRPALEVASPLDGRVLAAVPLMGTDEVRETVARAREVQRAWAAGGAGAWAAGVRALARVLDRRAPDIACRVREETGKPRTEAMAEVAVSADLLRFYGRAAPRHLAPRRVGPGWLVGKSARVEREPYGVVGAITPWNYPFIMVMDTVAPAVAAGNAVVVKPSEYTPWTALLVPDLCAEAGLPRELVQVVTGDGSTGAALVDAPVDRIVFTGSTVTGRRVMEAAAAHLTPVTLELGGKDPAIVLADADLERSARGIAYGAFFNAGQTCISVERALVDRRVYDTFLERVTEVAAGLRAGADDGADVGPMVAPSQVEVVERHVADAVARGARALTGGRRLTPGARVFLPTVLADARPDMAVMREETFGPVLPVMAVDGEEEAVAVANGVGYGLFASVWTGDLRRGAALARRLRAGGVSVNDALSHYAVPGLPMGGVGDSGFGRRRGLEALDEMSRTRTLLEHRVGLKREPWWFPYSPAGERLVDAVLGWRAEGGPRGLASAVGRLVRGRR